MRILLRGGLGTLFALALMALPVHANAPRDQYLPFTRDSSTINDDHTKLAWTRAAFTDLTHDIATASCTGRRLPTAKELLTLVDEEPHDEYEFGMNVRKYIDAAAFPGTPVSAPYWTSTKMGKQVIVVDFSTGETSLRDPATPANARCVK